MKHTVKPPHVDTSVKWTPIYSGHLLVPRAFFAGNKPLQYGHLSIVDCGHFFSVPRLIENLFNVNRNTIHHIKLVTCFYQQWILLNDETARTNQPLIKDNSR